MRVTRKPKPANTSGLTSIRRTMANLNNTKLRRRVFEAVVNGKGRGARKVQQAVDPYSKLPYPTRNIGSPSKVPTESRPYGWGLYSSVRNALGVKAIPGSFIDSALDARSKVEYRKEWSTATKKKMSVKAKQDAEITTKKRMAQWDPVITRNITNANERNSRIVSSDLIQKIKKQGTATIVDLGAGAGNTILPVLQKLSPQQKQKVKVVLVDVSVKDVHATKQEVMKLGILGGNVIAVVSDFGTLHRAKAIQSILGKADIITSGAALHHVSRSQAIFSTAQKLLKKGGSFKFWDWSHPAWRSGTLLVAPKGAKVSVDGIAYSLNGKIVKAQRGTAFLSQEKGIYPYQRSELKQTREMLSTWISLLNFSKKEKKRYKNYFDRLVAEGKPIRFAEYLQKLESVKPSSEAKPQVMEAHKTYQHYLRALKSVGFNTKQPLFSPDSGLLVQYSATKK